MKTFPTLAAALVGAALISGTPVNVATAAPHFEKKILHFNGPEVKAECRKWAKPWKGAKICVGHAYKFMAHEFYLVAEGPQVNEAVTRVVRDAAATAIATGAAVAAATPGEIGIKASTGLAAAKVAFSRALSASALTRAVAGQYSIRLVGRHHWPA